MKSFISDNRLKYMSHDFIRNQFYTQKSHKKKKNDLPNTH